MSESMALVGLDVHQAQTVAAVLDPVSGELRVQRLRGEPMSVVPTLLEALGRPVRAVYRRPRPAASATPSAADGG
jgi:hypothetical protein